MNILMKRTRKMKATDIGTQIQTAYRRIYQNKWVPNNEECLPKTMKPNFINKLENFGPNSPEKGEEVKDTSFD